MEQSFQRHEQCLISGSKNLTPLKGYEKHYLVKSHPVGFVFCSRVPTQEELELHYQGYNINLYYSEITRLRYRELLNEFEPFRKTNKLLDIGCGSGFFLEEAKAKGWEVYGTEYTDRAIKMCEEKGIKMNKGALNANAYEKDMFDVVTSFEVIEHIYNPIDEVNAIHKILRKGGLVYMTTPNFNSIERYVLKVNYNIIQYPEHLSYYTSRTINYLFAKNGFSKWKIKTTGISLSRLRISVKAMRNRADDEPLVSATSADEIIREKSQTNPLFKLGKTGLNEVLNLFKVGNSLKAWFIKS